VAVRKRLKAADRRRQILQVATPLFTEGGLDSVSTSEIARRAGVTQPVLYQHFASKEDLYADAVLAPLSAHLDVLVERVRGAVVAEPDREGRLARIEEHWIATMVEAGPFLGAVMFARRETAAVQYRAVVTPRLREICDLLRQHVLPEGMPEDAAWRYVRAVFGMNLLIVFDAMQRDEAPDVTALARDLNLLLRDGQSGL
jgi:AcrR family transcriptional regulator